jgi:hypothetical protein
LINSYFFPFKKEYYLVEFHYTAKTEDKKGDNINISVASFIFILKVLEPIILPSYKGSTLRGGFGSAFRSVVCVMREKECRENA